VIGRTVQRYSGSEKAAKGICEQTPFRIEYRKMIKSGRTGWRRTSIFAFPGIQTNVVMISARAHKGCFIADSRNEFEAENATIKIQGTIKIGNFEMHMPDPHA
jgi:hypothetical protein